MSAWFSARGNSYAAAPRTPVVESVALHPVVESVALHPVAESVAQPPVVESVAQPRACRCNRSRTVCEVVK